MERILKKRKKRRVREREKRQEGLTEININKLSCSDGHILKPFKNIATDKFY